MHVQEQLGHTDIKIPSSEFLVILRDVPVDSIGPPETAFQSSKPKEKKKTLVGNAFRWVGSKFRKKDD
jgi:hypothetical protein